MNNLLPSCKGNFRWIHENGNTRDIISVVIEAVDDPAVKRQTEQLTADLSYKYPSPFSLCKALWGLVKDGVTYQEDVQGEQLVKDPACTLGYTADCKSMTVFIASVLHNAGISYKVRFTKYNLLGDYTHVYPVALINGREVPVDAVHKIFNNEVSYLKKKDFKRMARIARISGLPGQQKRQIPTSGTDGELYLHLLRRQLQLKQLFTNDRRTKKVLGQGMNILDSSLVQGLHKYGRRSITGQIPDELQFLGGVLDQAASRTKPATSFKGSPRIGTTDYDPTPEQHIECVQSVITLDSYFDLQGNPCDPTTGTLLDSGVWMHPTCRPDWDGVDPDFIGECRLQKFYENLFNEYLEEASPSLLYSFINDENDVPNLKTTGLIKRQEQLNFMGGLQRISGVSESNFRMWTRNGIVAVNGQTPETVISRWNTATVTDHDAMIGCPPCAIVVPIVVAIVGALAAVAQTAIQARAKSPTEAALEGIETYTAPPSTLKQVMGPGYGDWNPKGSGSNGGGGDGSGSNDSSPGLLPLLALGAAGYFLMNKKRN